MAGCHARINDAIAHWNIPRVITYAMPPYMTLRLQLHINPPPPVARPRLLWDMTTKGGKLCRPTPTGSSFKGYGSGAGYGGGRGGGGSFMPISTESASGGNGYAADMGFGAGGGFGSGSQESAEESYKIDPSSTKETTMHDKRNKTIVYKPQKKSKSNGLGAVLGENSGAKFKITNYMKVPPGGKQAVTLQVGGGYLSCKFNSGKWELTVENFNGNLDVIQGDTRRFLFLQTSEGQTTFQSLVKPDMYISTNDRDISDVSLSSNTDQNKIFDFTFDGTWVTSPDQSKFTGSGILIIGDRIAVYIPKYTLDIITRQNTYERLPMVTTEKYFVGRVTSN